MSIMKEESLLLPKIRKTEKLFGLETEIKWKASFFAIAYHVSAVYWIYHYALLVKWQSVMLAYTMFLISGFGVTAGAHRYWAHRAFKATTPLRLILLFAFASAAQLALREWVWLHRVHHKYSDTESDPHNSRRGLFFAHIGWLLMEKKEEVTSKANEIDMRDIDNDPLVTWYCKYVNIVNPLVGYILPTVISILLWREDWRVAIAWQCFIKFLYFYHIQLSVNSFGHTIGNKPYDKNLRPADNFFISVLTWGDGSHNYHHVFPFDYKSCEKTRKLHLTTTLLLLAERLGWVYDKREATQDIVKKYIAKQTIVCG